MHRYLKYLPVCHPSEGWGPAGQWPVRPKRPVDSTQFASQISGMTEKKNREVIQGINLLNRLYSHV